VQPVEGDSDRTGDGRDIGREVGAKRLVDAIIKFVAHWKLLSVTVGQERKCSFRTRNANKALDATNKGSL
jgi:hypothetical protein